MTVICFNYQVRWVQISFRPSFRLQVAADWNRGLFRIDTLKYLTLYRYLQFHFAVLATMAEKEITVVGKSIMVQYCSSPLYRHEIILWVISCTFCFCQVVNNSSAVVYSALLLLLFLVEITINYFINPTSQAILKVFTLWINCDGFYSNVFFSP